MPAAVTVNVRAQNMNPGLTPAQGRVCMHQERLFGARRYSAEHREFLADMERYNLPSLIGELNDYDCQLALALMQRACRPWAGFIDTDTQWEDLV